ncbi:MAG: NADH-quinone oxidoreductase subunit NuoG, partial [Nitrospiraceae bacterium]|nr:NADH-quinone oxidoreductase subunit NuoG [Nitrospiraceae bacterium]
DTALGLGFDLPYFCWHPAMHSVGACRQCAVKQFKDEDDREGKIVMACMTAASEGTRISIKDREAVEFRASVIEWLMLNHPHDCPVCDEGGECHLQDMTVMTGHAYRRTRFRKRTYRNQYLGPFVNHEMNRCIQCYRCTRFYNDYAGGRDFGVFAAHDAVYFGRQEEGVLENEFSGNLVEVCPTGVFTDKTLKRHYTRKWDLQTAPSVCVHCGLGCNTIPGERYGTLRRILNRYNGQVNGYFICDRGRYGYEFVNSDRRIRRPYHVTRTASGMRQENTLDEGRVLPHMKSLLEGAKGIVGIGSPRASLEANYLLRRLSGPENFYAGFSDTDFDLVGQIISVLTMGPVRTPSLQAVSEADAVFILGEDVPDTAPRLGLAVRQSVRQRPSALASKTLGIPLWHDYAIRDAVQDRKGPLFIAALSATRIDPVSEGVFRGAPDDIARLGFAVAAAISPNASAPEGPLPEDAARLAALIAARLREAERPVIISGTGAGSLAVIRAASNVAHSLLDSGIDASLCFVVPECNSIGLGLLGGGRLKDAARAVTGKKADTVIVLENDLFDRLDAPEASALLGARQVIVIDHTPSHTSSMAHTVLPAAAFAEGSGTFINNEGRAQRFYKVYPPGGQIEESWRWLLAMLAAPRLAASEDLFTLDDVLKALAREMPALSGVLEAAPSADFRVAGLKIPRQPHRYSGRTAILADVDVNEPKPPMDVDTPLSFSMEGFEGRQPSALISRFWAPGWNSVQAVNKFQSEAGGPLAGGDPGKRLIEPVRNGSSLSYFADIPPPFKRALGGKFLVTPLYHVFGSEKLSALSPAVSELVPAPYLALNPEDAGELPCEEGGQLRLTVGGVSFRLPARFDPSVPRGLAGFPFGLPGMHGVRLPAWGSVEAASIETGKKESRGNDQEMAGY